VDLLKIRPVYAKNGLGFKQNALIFAEKWRESLKIVISVCYQTMVKSMGREK
jgi:hypothetical protein